MENITDKKQESHNDVENKLFLKIILTINMRKATEMF